MAEDSRKLFVAGLPDSITEDVLRQLFEATGGTVVEVSLPKDRATGRPRPGLEIQVACSRELSFQCICEPRESTSRPRLDCSQRDSDEVGDLAL